MQYALILLSFQRWRLLIFLESDSYKRHEDISTLPTMYISRGKVCVVGK